MFGPERPGANDTEEKILLNHILGANDRGFEFLKKWIIKEGILSIQEGDNPRIVLEKLGACLGENLYLEIRKQKELHGSHFLLTQ